MIGAHLPVSTTTTQQSPPPVSSPEANVQALYQKMSLVALAKDIETSQKDMSHLGDKCAAFQQRISDAQRLLEAGPPTVRTLEKIEGLIQEGRQFLELQRTEGFDLVVKANVLRASFTELAQWKNELPVWGHNVGESLKMLDRPPLSVRTLLMLEGNLESARNELNRVRGGG